MIRQVLAALILLMPTFAFAGNVEIEERCTFRFPNVWQYFAWKDCVKAETRQEFEETLERQRELQARPCLASDIPRMEAIAVQARQTIKEEWSLEEAQAALSRILGYQGAISVPEDNIKERVLVYSIRTKCDAPFRFLINVRAGQDQRLRWQRTWAENAPKGYPADYHRELSVEFETLRQQERDRVEAAKREEDFKASMAKLEQDREQRRQTMLKSFKISNTSMKCGATCALRSLDFVVTNTSSEPIEQISFGWMFRSPQVMACPPKLATKERMFLVLQPGESTPVKILVPNAPEDASARLCLSVTDVDFGFPWKR